MFIFSFQCLILKWKQLKYQSIGCRNIHGTYVTANNSTNYVVFIFVSDLKIVYYNNY